MEDPTRADIKSDTEILVHEAIVNPTNAEILDKFAEHTKHDEQFQDETRLVHAAQAESAAEMEGKLASLESKMDALATKEDIDKVLRFIKDINISIGIFKFTWNNAAKIGSLLSLVLGLFIFFKVGIAGVIAFFSLKQ